MASLPSITAAIHTLEASAYASVCDFTARNSRAQACLRVSATDPEEERLPSRARLFPALDLVAVRTSFSCPEALPRRDWNCCVVVCLSPHSLGGDGDLGVI